MKKYYKVVCSDLTSACVNYMKGFATQYKIGEYVSSPFVGSKLFICENLEQAIEFRKTCCPGGDIYEVSAIGVTKLIPAYFHTRIEKYWNIALKFIQKKKKVNLKSLRLQVNLDDIKFPNGALCAKKVKLLKRVENV